MAAVQCSSLKRFLISGGAYRGHSGVIETITQSNGCSPSPKGVVHLRKLVGYDAAIRKTSRNLDNEWSMWEDTGRYAETTEEAMTALERYVEDHGGRLVSNKPVKRHSR